MNTRPLTSLESDNLVCLNQTGLQSVLLLLTDTGIAKSILDATDPIRRLFQNRGIHDYSQQMQGEQSKRMITASIVTDAEVVPVRLSLYRPETKEGDPRMWFYGLKSFADGGDVCAIFIHADSPVLLNLSRSYLAKNINDREHSFIAKYITKLSEGETSKASELVENLRVIAARGLLKSVGHGATTIGMSIEAALGIAANSSKKPDYHGIELKSGRSSLSGAKKNRTTLFACVPNWTLSNAKSSKEILDRFGYSRGGQFKLYCTVSSLTPNSQGLVFELEQAKRWLCEVFTRGQPRNVAIWDFDRLERSLLQKHKETFWITARSHTIKGVEHFELKSIQHTRNPNILQLFRMLEDGSITMDHLIKRTAAGGGHERGPLFKIWPKKIPELFLGEFKEYQLV